MTAQEAIKMLKYNSNVIHKAINGETDINEVEALDMAISALEKQIPKELIAEGDGYADGSMVYDSFYCPSCDHHMEWDEVEDYCPKCGQKICWEEGE